MSALFGSTDTELLLKEETGIVQVRFALIAQTRVSWFPLTIGIRAAGSSETRPIRYPASVVPAACTAVESDVK